MKTNAVLITLAAVALFAITINAGNVDHQRARGRNAHAVFQSVDTSVCPQGIVTTVTVVAEVGGLAAQGAIAEVPVLAVTIEVYDRCLDRRLIFATGQSSTNFNLRIDPNLNTASVRGRILIHEFISDTSDYFDVDVAWNGIGTPARERLREVDHSPGLTENEHFIATTRDAIASGSVSATATGQQIIRDLAVSASLQKVQGIGVEIEHH